MGKIRQRKSDRKRSNRESSCTDEMKAEKSSADVKKSKSLSEAGEQNLKHGPSGDVKEELNAVQKLKALMKKQESLLSKIEDTNKEPTKANQKKAKNKSEYFADSQSNSGTKRKSVSKIDESSPTKKRKEVCRKECLKKNTPSTSSTGKTVKATKQNKKEKKNEISMANKKTADIIVKPCMSEDKLSSLDEVTRLLALHEKGGMLQSGVLSDDEESDDSEWEEVEEAVSNQDNARLSKVNMPKEPVEITLQGPTFNQKKRNKKFDMEEHLRLQINKLKKLTQLDCHKVHLLCLLARCQMLNSICNEHMLQGVALSMVPSIYHKIKTRDWSASSLTQLLRWMNGHYRVVPELIDDGQLNENVLLLRLQQQRLATCTELVMICVLTLRSLGLDVRLVQSLQPMTYKATDLKAKGSLHKDPPVIDLVDDDNDTQPRASSKGKNVKSKNDLKSTNRSKGNSSKLVAEKKNSKDNQSEKKSQPKNQKPRKRASKIDDDVCSISSDEDFDPDNITYRSPKTSNEKKKKSKNEKIVSSDSEESVKITKANIKEKGRDEWAEVYLASEERWLSMDCVKCQLGHPDALEAAATKPLVYVMSIDNESRMKDITMKYVDPAEIKKLRPDKNWWKDSVALFRGDVDLVRDKAEDYDIAHQQQKQPLPTSVAAFKGHPLYVLPRHLLKFEAIYPPDAVPVGYCKGEPVYMRECVHGLHSKETWMKEAKAIRIGEEPYKMVKARPKRSRPHDRPDEPTLPVYGEWQTEPYIPPPAVDGKVPRNDYGNIELFKPCMLPAGTVHLRLPGLQKVAKKLNIDCASAMIGWDTHGGFSVPVMDGFVVCEEFQDVLIAAWDEEQEIIKEREKEKREKRVYDNWKKLIRGLRIKEKMKKKFNLVEPELPSTSSKDTGSKKGKLKKTGDKDNVEKPSDVALSWPLNRQAQKEQKGKEKEPLFPFEVI